MKYQHLCFAFHTCNNTIAKNDALINIDRLVRLQTNRSAVWQHCCAVFFRIDSRSGFGIFRLVVNANETSTL